MRRAEGRRGREALFEDDFRGLETWRVEARPLLRAGVPRVTVRCAMTTRTASVAVSWQGDAQRERGRELNVIGSCLLLAVFLRKVSAFLYFHLAVQPYFLQDFLLRDVVTSASTG